MANIKYDDDNIDNMYFTWCMRYVYFEKNVYLTFGKYKMKIFSSHSLIAAIN